MRGYLQLLRRNPNYARLWLAQSVSLLGDWFSTIALSALVARYSDPKYVGTAISFLLLAHFLPPLLIGPYAGVLVDKLDRRLLLIISDVARCVIVFGLLFVNNSDTLWLLYILVILQFCFAALFEPGRSALMPSLVSPSDLVQANVLGSVTWSVMLAAGAAIGGAVASVFGTRFALAIDATSFALSALLIASIRVDHKVDADSKPKTDAPKRGFHDGLRFARAHPGVFAALFVKMGGSVGSIDALMVIYATQLFVVGEQGTGSLGLFYSAFGLGAVLGPALLQRVNDGSVQRMRRLILIGYGLISVGWLFFGGAPLLLLVAGAILIKAMGSSIYWTYSSVIIQKSVPDEYLGRMFALDLAGFQLMTVISTIITGILTNNVAGEQVRAVAFGTGLLSLIPLALWALVVPRLERHELTDPHPSLQAGD
jgi:MFS family permease